MSYNIDELWTTTFSTMLKQEMAERRDPVSSTFTMGTYEGEVSQVEVRVDKMTLTEITSRYQAAVPSSPSAVQRWLAPRTFAAWRYAQDMTDVMRMLTDLDSKMLSSMRDAAQQQTLILAMGAFFGTALTGDKGSVSETWDYSTATSAGGQNVLVNHESTSNTGLTLAKLDEVLTVMETNFALDEPKPQIYAAINARQHKQLRREVRSQAFGQFEAGKVDEYLGIMFKHTQRTPTLPSNPAYSAVPFWIEDGMHIGWWSQVKTKALPDVTIHDYPIKTEISMSANCTRLDAKKVILVQCSNT